MVEIYAIGIAFLAGLAALVAAWTRGSKAAKDSMRVDDYENAEDIRRRVRDDTDERVRGLDGAGYRD